jgi:hypothetical protein
VLGQRHYDTFRLVVLRHPVSETADPAYDERDDAHPCHVSFAADDRIADEQVREWLGDGATRTPLVAMNSSTWMVSSGAERYVLKIASASEQPASASRSGSTRTDSERAYLWSRSFEAID